MANIEKVEEQKVFIVAEIGVNHGGDLELAKKMVVAAKESGADAVKFQTFTADALVTKKTAKVGYQLSTTDPNETHFEMIQKLELSRESHPDLMGLCQEMGVEFISTPYDLDSAIFLNDLGVSTFKTASADIVDLPLQEFLASTEKKVIVATGMASLGEVDEIVRLYKQKENDQNLILLHCVSNYPCSLSSLNLNVMKTMKEAFRVSVGYSDHSIGTQAAVIAVALGARVIEKHFTLDKNLRGPDHKASSLPEEFAELTKAIRNAEVALGTYLKECQDEEKQMRRISRKSIVLSRAIRAGEIITRDHLVMKRPGTGIMPAEISNVLMKQVVRDMSADELLGWNDIK